MISKRLKEKIGPPSSLVLQVIMKVKVRLLIELKVLMGRYVFGTNATSASAFHRWY